MVKYGFCFTDMGGKSKKNVRLVGHDRCLIVVVLVKAISKWIRKAKRPI